MASRASSRTRARSAASHQSTSVSVQMRGARSRCAPDGRARRSARPSSRGTLVHVVIPAPKRDGGERAPRRRAARARTRTSRRRSCRCSATSREITRSKRRSSATPCSRSTRPTAAGSMSRVGVVEPIAVDPEHVLHAELARHGEPGAQPAADVEHRGGLKALEQDAEDLARRGVRPCCSAS